MATNLEIAGAVKRTQKGDADWYYGGDAEAWPDLATAKLNVPASIRPGKTIGVFISGSIVEYWWPTSAVSDSDLIEKTTPLPQALGTGDSPLFQDLYLANSLNVAYVNATHLATDSVLIFNETSHDLTVNTQTLTDDRIISLPDKNGVLLVDSDIANKVDTSTTVNSKALSSNITLNADDISEKTISPTNLYLTAGRVLATVLTGIGFGTVSAVLAADSILTAVGKLQAQITNIYNTTVSLSSNNPFTGTNTYGNTTTYNGRVIYQQVESAASGIGRGLNYQQTVRATAPNDVLYGVDFTNMVYDTATNGTSARTATLTSAGTGYTNGTAQYLMSPITGGGSGGLATLTVSGGVVTALGIQDNANGTGSGYHIGDTFTVTSAGGTGFVGTVATVIVGSVTKIDARLSTVLPLTSDTGFIGSNALRYKYGYINQIFVTNLLAGTGTGIGFYSSSQQPKMLISDVGNLLLSTAGGIDFADNGWGFEIKNARTAGAIKTSGAINQTTGLARAWFLNNDLNLADNNDIAVGLDINNTPYLGATSIQTLGSITGGTGYTNGTQTFALTGGSPTIAATASITRVGGIVTSATILSRGKGYAPGNTLSATIPGGSGFSIPVATIGLTGTSYLSIRTSGGALIGGDVTLALGAKIKIATGSNASAGTSALSGGTVIVNTTAVTSASIIMLNYNTPGGMLGILGYSFIVAGTSFVINSLLSDRSLNTSDTSIINWFIIN